MAILNNNFFKPSDIIGNVLSVSGKKYIDNGFFIGTTSESSSDIVGYSVHEAVYIFKDGGQITPPEEYLREKYITLKDLPGWNRVLDDKEIEELGEQINNGYYVKIPSTIDLWNMKWAEPGFDIQCIEEEEQTIQSNLLDDDTVTSFEISEDSDYTEDLMSAQGYSIDKVVDILNSCWEKLDVKPFYEEFNKKYPVSKNILEIEAKIPEVGVVVRDINGNYINHVDISTEKFTFISHLSMIATITDLLTGYRIGVDLDDEGRISKWSVYNNG